MTVATTWYQTLQQCEVVGWAIWETGVLWGLGAVMLKRVFLGGGYTHVHLAWVGLLV